MALGGATSNNLDSAYSYANVQYQKQAGSHTASITGLLSELPAGVVMIDTRGYVTFANQTAETLLAMPLAGELWRSVILRAFKPRKDDGHEVSLINGKRVKLAISSMSYQPGQLILITDLTETRKVQERSSHIKRLSSLGKMVASVAHQIRTPLAAATLYAANLKNPTLSSSARLTFVDKLLGRLKDLEGQVNDMLLFAKSDQQVISVINVKTLLEQVIQACDSQLHSHQVKLNITVPDEHVYMLGNETALSGAFENLVMNSVQVLPRNGEVNIVVEHRSSSHWVIHVSDNGPGIDNRIINKIFEPFFTTKTQGTGLGLAVVKTVVQSHKGQISVSSELGKGTCFSMQFPRYHDTEGEFLSHESSRCIRSHSA